MKNFIKYCIIAILLTGCASSEKVITRNLKWSDFTGKPDASSKYEAMTNYKVNYTYTATFENGIAIINLKVKPVFKPDSWVDPAYKTPYLLTHEQGHYNLAVCCAREFKKEIHSTTFYEDSYDAAIKSIFEDVWSSYEKLQKRYDEETQHSDNKVQQDIWNNRITEMLGQWPSL